MIVEVQMTLRVEGESEYKFTSEPFELITLIELGDDVDSVAMFELAEERAREAVWPFLSNNSRVLANALCVRAINR